MEYDDIERLLRARIAGLEARVAELESVTDARIDEAVAQLFRDDKWNEAARLVLECKDGIPGGGWCRSAVVDVLRAALRGEPKP